MRDLQLQKYLSLPQGGKVIAEYVWIDGSNGIRSKSKVSNFLRRFLHIHTTCFAAFATLSGSLVCRVQFESFCLKDHRGYYLREIHILVGWQQLGVVRAVGHFV
jgi:hypothetical protein